MDINMINYGSSSSIDSVDPMLINNPMVLKIISEHCMTALECFQNNASAAKMVDIRMKNSKSISDIIGVSSSSNDTTTTQEDMLVNTDEVSSSNGQNLLVNAEDIAMGLFQIINSHREEALSMFKASTPASQMISLRMKNLSSMKELGGSTSLSLSALVLQEQLVNAEEDAKLFDKDLLRGNNSSCVDEVGKKIVGDNIIVSPPQREGNNKNNVTNKALGTTDTMAKSSALFSASSDNIKQGDDTSSKPNGNFTSKNLASLTEAAAMGCGKCKKELDSGEKTNEHHKDGCPRKRRPKSSTIERSTDGVSPQNFNIWKGSSWSKNGKNFTSQIGCKNTSYSLGSYQLSSDAARVYDKATMLLRDPGYKLNFATSEDYISMRNLEIKERKLDNVVDLDEMSAIIDSKVNEVVSKVKEDSLLRLATKKDADKVEDEIVLSRSSRKRTQPKPFVPNQSQTMGGKKATATLTTSSSGFTVNQMQQMYDGKRVVDMTDDELRAQAKDHPEGKRVVDVLGRDKLIAACASREQRPAYSSLTHLTQDVSYTERIRLNLINCLEGKEFMPRVPRISKLGMKWCQKEDTGSSPDNNRVITGKADDEMVVDDEPASPQSFNVWKGSSWNKAGKYFASQIACNNIGRPLGYYQLSSDAARAYDKATMLLRDPGYKLNFATSEEYISMRSLEIKERKLDSVVDLDEMSAIIDSKVNEVVTEMKEAATKYEEDKMVVEEDTRRSGRKRVQPKPFVAYRGQDSAYSRAGSSAGKPKKMVSHVLFRGKIESVGKDKSPPNSASKKGALAPNNPAPVPHNPIEPLWEQAPSLDRELAWLVEETALIMPPKENDTTPKLELPLALELALVHGSNELHRALSASVPTEVKSMLKSMKNSSPIAATGMKLKQLQEEAERGDRVFGAWWQEGVNRVTTPPSYYPGTIDSYNTVGMDRFYSVLFDDGEESHNLKSSHIMIADEEASKLVLVEGQHLRTENLESSIFESLREDAGKALLLSYRRSDSLGIMMELLKESGSTNKNAFACPDNNKDSKQQEGRVITISVFRPSKEDELGLGVEKRDDRMAVTSIAPGIFDGSQLDVGMIIDSVNGSSPFSYKDALRALQNAEGRINIVALSSIIVGMPKRQPSVNPQQHFPTKQNLSSCLGDITNSPPRKKKKKMVSNVVSNDQKKNHMSTALFSTADYDRVFPA